MRCACGNQVPRVCRRRSPSRSKTCRVTGVVSGGWPVCRPRPSSARWGAVVATGGVRRARGADATALPSGALPALDSTTGRVVQGQPSLRSQNPTEQTRLDHHHQPYQEDEPAGTWRVGSRVDRRVCSPRCRAQQVPTLGTVPTQGSVKGRADRTGDLQGRSGSRLCRRHERVRARRGRGSRAWRAVIRTGRDHTTRLLRCVGALSMPTQQHLERLRRQEVLRGAATLELAVRLSNDAASHCEGSALYPGDHRAGRTPTRLWGGEGSPVLSPAAGIDGMTATCPKRVAGRV